MREAWRFWRGVRGLETNWRLGGIVRADLVLERRVVDFEGRAEDGRRKSNWGLAFMIVVKGTDVETD